MIGAAVGCAVLFAVLNAGIVALAAHLADPEAPLAKVLWDRESLLLDLTETCVGILVAVTCALSFLLLLVALPPVILLQRSLMHQQLAAAALTDPKTGLAQHGSDLFELLAAADLALYRAKDAGRNQVRLYAPGE